MSNKVLLNQIISIEKGVKNRVNKELTAAHHAVQKPELLSGLARSYKPKDDEGDRLPDENQKIQIRAEDMLSQTATILTELFDITASKDWTNCAAKADVVVDGKVLIAGAPISFLLFLEKNLTDISTFVSKLPILDPTQNWTYDSTQDCYKSEVAQTLKTKKVMKNHVLSEATKEHPQVTNTYNEEVVIGTWNTTRYSSALPATRVKTLMNRVTALQKAVKFAREQANTTEADQKFVGEELFDYLFAKS